MGNAEIHEHVIQIIWYRFELIKRVFQCPELLIGIPAHLGQVFKSLPEPFDDLGQIAKLPHLFFPNRRTSLALFFVSRVGQFLESVLCLPLAGLSRKFHDTYFHLILMENFAKRRTGLVCIHKYINLMLPTGSLLPSLDKFPRWCTLLS